jgi:phosphoglycerate dehydrogenase-like enzyme
MFDFPKQVLIGASDGDAVAAAIQAARPALAVRVCPAREVTSDDLAWADTYVGFRRPALASLGNVRWVHCTGAGVDAWLVPDPIDRSILLTRSSESFGPRMAEWTIARVLQFLQRLRDFDAYQEARVWSPREITSLADQRVCVVGTGDVGRHVARAFGAFGAPVRGVSRSGQLSEHAADVFEDVATLARLREVMAWATVVVLTVPLTAESRGLVGAAELAVCRGALILNVGRGAVLDEAALLGALNLGTIAGAALDVFVEEPLPPASPLWSHPQVVISPHVSGLTTVNGAVRGFLDVLASIEAGGPIAWRVDRTRGY